MTKCFNTLHKDPDQQYSDRQKVEKLLKAIRCQDPELLAAKVVVDQQYPHNFIGACGYFLQQVTRIHGPSQLENHQSKTRSMVSTQLTATQVAEAMGEAVMAVVAAEVVEDTRAMGEDHIL